MKGKIIRCIILLIFMTLLLFGVSVCEKFVKIYQNNISGNPFLLYYSFLIQFIVYCIAGMIFGFEKILSEGKKIGHWSINLPRLLLVGLPSFLVGIYIILTLKFAFIPQFLNLNFVNFGLFVSFMQMLFGYTIITSFYKIEKITNK